MKELKKCKLDFDHTLKYVKDNLEKTNTLSSELLNLVNFTCGNFFTLLPTDAALEKIHDFKTGGILPQNTIEEYFISGRKATYSLIPTIQDEIGNFILEKIKECDKISCIFDDVLSSQKDKNSDELIQLYGLFFQDEVYYLIKKKFISKTIILDCLKKSNVIWHSLCVLTKANFSNYSKIELGLDKMKEICINSELIIIGAYDGEGYIFWEKMGN